MTEPVGTIEHLDWQYGDAGGYIVGEIDDAVTATVFSPGSDLILHLIRTRRGRWRIDATDTLVLFSGEWRTSWASPADALADIAGRRNLTPRRVSL